MEHEIAKAGPERVPAGPEQVSADPERVSARSEQVSVRSEQVSAGPGRAGDEGTGRGRAGWLLVAGIVLLTLNLRPALVAVSPLTPLIGGGGTGGLSSSAISLLTSLPLLCFGLLAPVSPRVGRRLGIERSLVVAMALVIAGTAVRAIPDTVALFAGTVVIGAGIAIGNVLLPSLIKRDFPQRVGPMMGMFSMTLFGGAAVAAGLTVPLQHASGLGWRAMLACWGAPAVLAAVVWLPQLRSRSRLSAQGVRDAAHPVRGLWRQPLAWHVTAFMGLQSLTYYAATAWIPTLLQSSGTSQGTAGWMLSFSSLLGIAGSFLAPVVAERQMPAGAVAVLSSVLCAGGIAGILAAPAAVPYLWMVLLGLGQGGAISLALLFIVQRAPDTRHVAQLSSMAQSFGYVLAAFGPLALGALHDATGHWTLPLVVLLALLVPQACFGVAAGRNRHVRADDTTTAVPSR
ncbi:MFS transporter [Streptomyces sp. TS71-3]|uniref:CynX/NimT family MFS transporter n=1 Tax=Streptomyces sp. TS71-3 TaxID=2733862 RepID=UPI001AFF0485|nr:MFS transporter [Streptomyces sp. TS71-3]GHJ37054.1 MFS transporter [Streptomyces sp. TS71-3]